MCSCDRSLHKSFLNCPAFNAAAAEGSARADRPMKRLTALAVKVVKSTALVTPSAKLRVDVGIKGSISIVSSAPQGMRRHVYIADWYVEVVW